MENSHHFLQSSSRKAHLYFFNCLCRTEKTMAQSVLPGWIVPFQRAIAAVRCRGKKKCFLCNTAGFLATLPARRGPAVSNKGMFMLSIKAWAVIKTHFFILMNANWHICYGGLAVQTLQLAWLINYRPAGGAVEMEAAAEMGVEVMKGGGGGGGREWEMKAEREGGDVRKWSETFVLQITFFSLWFD